MQMTNMKLKIPKQVEKVLLILEQNNFISYIVGGAVRDMLLNRPIHDYDIATPALPWQVKEIFSKYHVIETGIKHGTITIVIDNMSIEVTSFRIDCKISSS